MTTTRPKFKAVDVSGLDTSFDEITKGFLPIKVRSLFSETVLPCDVHFLAHKKGDGHGLGLNRLLRKNSIYTLAFHRYLVDQEVDEAYIGCDDEERFNAYSNHHTQEALQTGDASPEKKAELLYDQAEYLVQKVFRERPTKTNIATGQQLVSQFSTHVLADQITSQALASLFSKDYYTFSHCVQVALLGMSLCKAVGWKAKEVEDFGLGALFHDIGKSAIDERVLNKPGKLDRDEFELIKKHPLLGYQQIKDTQVMTKDQLSVVLQHHEALDGSGYPCRLKEFQIHKYARAARIVDIYDALTTKRVYKEALPIQEALRIMNDEMRHTLDIRLFEAFTKHLHTDKKTEEIRSGAALHMKMGTQMELQFEGEVVPVKGVLAGWEVNRTIMVRVPASGQIRDHLEPSHAVTARFACSDALHSFRSTVLKHVWHPFPLLFLSYPESVERVDLRKNRRTDSFIRVKVLIGKEQHPGAIVDLSREGCRLMVKFSSGCPEKTIAINDRIKFAADFSGKKKYELLEGTICNALLDNDKAVLGVHFMELPPAIQETIDRLCQGPVDVV